MNLALFDFDGTLTTHETFGDFMHAAVTPVRRALGIPLFAPLLAGYKLGRVSGVRIRQALVAYGFRGLPVTRTHAVGERFAEHFLPTVLRPEAMRRLA